MPVRRHGLLPLEMGLSSVQIRPPRRKAGCSSVAEHLCARVDLDLGIPSLSCLMRRQRLLLAPNGSTPAAPLGRAAAASPISGRTTLFQEGTP